MASVTPLNIPELTSRKPGLTVTIAGSVSAGVKKVADQIVPYTEFWSETNQDLATRSATPESLAPNLLIFIGDSSALGVGASTPENGYVRLVRDFVAGSTGDQCEVLVLARSGAKVSEGLDEFLPVAAEVLEFWSKHKAGTARIISCIGSNDIFWSLSLKRLQRQLDSLVGELPAGSLVATLAGGSPRAFACNAHLKKVTAENNLKVVEPWRNDLSGALSRIAEDKFHPNDYGYQRMADAFCEALDSTFP